MTNSQDISLIAGKRLGQITYKMFRKFVERNFFYASFMLLPDNSCHSHLRLFQSVWRNWSRKLWSNWGKFGKEQHRVAEITFPLCNLQRPANWRSSFTSSLWKSFRMNFVLSPNFQYVHWTKVSQNEWIRLTPMASKASTANGMQGGSAATSATTQTTVTPTLESSVGGGQYVSDWDPTSEKNIAAVTAATAHLTTSGTGTAPFLLRIKRYNGYDVWLPT